MSSLKRSFHRLCHRLWTDERGATAVEYGLIVAAIAILILAVVMVLGRKVKNTFNNMSGAIP